MKPLCEMEMGQEPEKKEHRQGGREKFISMGMYLLGRYTLIYYRVAFQAEQPDTWRWRSTVLTSLQALLLLLRTYSSMPKERVRVFFCSSMDRMDEMLNRQNRGLLSNSVTAEQFLAAKRVNTMEVKRLELELSTAEDHDEVYTCTLPVSDVQLRAWTELMVRRRRGELES